jgi:putative PIN family toxin of toxin-antitoxin system
VRVVVDTNVIIAGLVAEGLCMDIVKRRLPSCQLFTSRPLLTELADKLRTEFGLDPGELPLLKHYESRVTVVRPTPLPEQVCRDKDDDEALATGLAARAEVILTGDNDLLELKEFRGIRILSPRQFVEMMDAAT